MTRPRKLSFMHFIQGAITVWLLCLALGTFLGWSMPWDWRNGSHTLAKTLALIGGLYWVWVKRIDLEIGD